MMKAIKTYLVLKMGNSMPKHSYVLSPEELSEIKKETGFSTSQVKRLFARFQLLDKDGKGYLTREELLLIKEIILNPIGEKIVDMFFPGETEQLTFQRFARVYSIFKPTDGKTATQAVNSREGKLKFLFSLVDTDGDGRFCRDEVFDLLELMIGSKVDEEQLNQITDRMIIEADTDGDGFVSFQEFSEATKELDVEGVMSFVAFS